MPHRIVTTGVQGFGPLPRLVRAQAGEAALERLFAAFEVPLTLLDRPGARLPLVDMAAIFDSAAALLGDARIEEASEQRLMQLMTLGATTPVPVDA